MPAEASVYADSAYTDYKIEDKLFENESVLLKVQRKSNSKRKDTKQQTIEKLKMRKRVETTISDIKKIIFSNYTCCNIKWIFNETDFVRFCITN